MAPQLVHTEPALSLSAFSRRERPVPRSEDGCPASAGSWALPARDWATGAFSPLPPSLLLEPETPHAGGSKGARSLTVLGGGTLPSSSLLLLAATAVGLWPCPSPLTRPFPLVPVPRGCQAVGFGPPYIQTGLAGRSLIPPANVLLVSKQGHVHRSQGWT